MRKRNAYGTARKKSKALWVLLGIVAIATIALGIAWFWQGAQMRVNPNKPLEESIPESIEEDVVSSLIESSVVESSEEESLPEETSVEESVEAASSQEESSEDSTENVPSTVDNLVFSRREEYPYALAQKEPPVGPEYFADAIFLGDSISTGIPLYLRSVLGDVAVVAETGISPRSVLTKEVFDLNGTKVPMLEKAASFGERSKVYILLGGNSLGYEKTPFMEGYQEFLPAVIAQYPNAAIYVQSITPVTAHATERYPGLGQGDINAKINDYNLAIMDLCQELGIHYLDIASVFVDAEGKLPMEASPSDGVHFGSDYYYRWYEYLRNHVA